MSTPSAKHFLNGHDLWDTYGIVISGGSASFLTMPKRKDSIAYDWQDEHGTQRDLTAPRFEEKQATLTGYFTASSFAQYESRRAAFYAELRQPGLQEWQVADNGQTYLVWYLSEGQVDKVFRTLQGTSLSALRFTLTLGVSVSAEDIAGSAGSGLPVTIYNFDGSVNSIIQGGGSYTLSENAGDIDGILLLEDGSLLAAEG